jgi:hypothetical protein
MCAPADQMNPGPQPDAERRARCPTFVKAVPGECRWAVRVDGTAQRSRHSPVRDELPYAREDAATDYGDVGSWTDVDGITAFMEKVHEPFGDTNHMLSNFVVDVDGDRAEATSYVHVVLALKGSVGGWVDSVGRYEDTLVRTPGGWQIANRRTRLTRTVTSS